MEFDEMDRIAAAFPPSFDVLASFDEETLGQVLENIESLIYSLRMIDPDYFRTPNQLEFTHLLFEEALREKQVARLPKHLRRLVLK